MREAKRIFISKKTVFLMVLLMCVNIVFFGYQNNEHKASTMESDTYKEYIDTYHQHIDETIVNASDMLSVSIFMDEDSYVYRNLKKTQADYEVLKGITLTEGDNQEIMSFFRFTLVDFLFLISGIYIVLCFLQERKKGLHLLVRSTTRGRAVLAMQRMVILFVGLVVSGALLYGSLLMITVSKADVGFDRSIQSISEFSEYVSRVTIGEYLMTQLLAKLVGVFMLCVFFYMLTTLISSSLSIIIFGLTLVAEYLLYIFLMPTDRMCAFKYMNLYTYVFARTDYGRYYNLNLFEYPVDSRLASTVLVVGLAVVFTVAAILKSRKWYPMATPAFLRKIDKLIVAFSKKKPIWPNFFWECRKVLLSQKGIWIGLIVFYLAFSASTDSFYVDTRNPYEMHWYEDLAGDINEEKLQEVTATRDQIMKWMDGCRKNLERYQATKEKYLMEGRTTQYVDKQIGETKAKLAEHEKEMIGLNIVYEKVESGLEYTKRTGKTIQIIDTHSYYLLLDHDKSTTTRNHLYIFIGMIGIFSGIIAHENTTHMRMYLHTLYKGRKKLIVNKVLLIACVAFVLSTAIHIIQFVQIGEVFGYMNLDAAVQSINSLRDFMPDISIGTYLTLMYIGRGFLTFLVGCGVMTISNFCKNRINTIAVCSGIMIVFILLTGISF